ncbi:MAG: tyrosine-type recombinase/integrase, partial [Campylobacterota bacterium]|nr:tyrosine-type recombinase/integrase [Campylobacterota bacterium]
MRKKNIFENPCEHIEKFKEVPREDISLRVLNKKPIEIIREIYHAIDKYDYAKHKYLEMNRMYWKMCVMTAHRMGEVLQLEKSHCYLEENKIVSPASITKTKEDYHFPIPDECLDYIKSVESGKLFTMSSSGSLYYGFQRILQKTNIKLVEGKTLSIHDVRKLMLSIMTKDLKIDSRLADYCLEHKQQGVIKHYL